MSEIRFEDVQIHLAKPNWEYRVFAIPQGSFFDPGTGVADPHKFRGPCICVVVTASGQTTATRYEINDATFWKWLARLLHDTEPDARLVVPGDDA
jgi:hypothetical protein